MSKESQSEESNRIDEQGRDARGANPADTFPGRKRGRKLRLAVASATLLGVGALGGALAAAAGGAFAHSGWRHGGGLSEAFIADRAGAKLERMMEVVDATPDQKARAEPIVDDLVSEVLPLIERHREHRRALMAAFDGSGVDRDAVEVIRTAELDLIDRASSAIADAATDIGAILTPEQREKVARLVAQHHDH